MVHECHEWDKAVEPNLWILHEEQNWTVDGFNLIGQEEQHFKLKNW